MVKLMPSPHGLHAKETIPTSRRTNDRGGHMLTSGPDVHNSHAREATSAMAENHPKTEGIGLQLQVECWYEQEELPEA